eukprot:gene10526-7312_t
MLRLLRVVLATVAITVLYLHVGLTPASFPDDILIEVPVHRAVRFDTRGDPFGARKGFLRAELVLPTGEDLARCRGKAVLLPCSGIRPAMLDGLIELPVNGVIVESCDPFESVDEVLQRRLLETAVPFPVFVLPPLEKEISTHLRRALQEGTASPSRLVAKVPDAAPAVAPLKRLQSTFVRGSVRRPPTDSVAAPPHVILTAHFDTLGAAPSQPTTANVFAVPAAVELWRRINALRPRATPEPFSFTVLLESSSHLGYGSTKSWIKNEGTRGVKPTIGLNVEELLPSNAEWDGRDAGAAPPLYVHLHKTVAKTPEGEEFLAKVAAAAAAAGVAVETVPGKNRYNHRSTLWEHEAFAHSDIPAATFTSLRTHSDQMQPDHVARTAPFSAPAVELVMRRVDFLHRLVELLLGLPHDSEAQWVGSEHLIDGLAHLGAHAVRSSPSLEAATTDAPSQEQFAAELTSVMRSAIPPISAGAPQASVVTSSVDVAWPVITLYPSPPQILTVFRGLPPVTKLIWSIVSAAIVVFYAAFNYAVADKMHNHSSFPTTECSLHFNSVFNEAFTRLFYHQANKGGSKEMTKLQGTARPVPPRPRLGHSDLSRLSALVSRFSSQLLLLLALSSSFFSVLLHLVLQNESIHRSGPWDNVRFPVYLRSLAVSRSGPTDKPLHLTFVLPDGSSKEVVGYEGQTLLDVAAANHLPMEGACAGSCACSTCHVYLEEGAANAFPEPTDAENDMIDQAFFPEPTSRLGCQLHLVKEQHDGLRVTLPKATRNMYVDGAVASPH